MNRDVNGGKISIPAVYSPYETHRKPDSQERRQYQPSSLLLAVYLRPLVTEVWGRLLVSPPALIMGQQSAGRADKRLFHSFRRSQSSGD
jgi:hypothetical protein